MDTLFWLAVATVVIVLFFDYTNGFHDAANGLIESLEQRLRDEADVGVEESASPRYGNSAN